LDGIRIEGELMSVHGASRFVLDHPDADLRPLLAALDPKARDDLPARPDPDQADRDAISSRLMRY
jgi:hypothetical protein